MTYRATQTSPWPQAPLLRRPADPDRPQAEAVAPAGHGGLPAFLKASPARAGYWSEDESPICIEGFDPREHILTLEFESGAAMPDLSIETDEDRAISALLANGKPMAVLHLESMGFSLDHVAITQSDD